MPDTALNWYIPDNTDKEPVVLLHGFMGCSGDWDFLIRELPEYSCYAPDLPGHGKSLFPLKNDPHKLTDTAEIILEDFKILGLDKAVVLGYSMGGRIALAIAAEHPETVTKLIIESASPGIEDEQLRIDRANNDHALSERISTFSNNRDAFMDFLYEWYRLPLFSTLQKNINLEHLIEKRLDNSAENLSKALVSMSPGRQNNYFPHMSKFEKPLFVITGDEDRKYRQIAEKMQMNCPETAIQIFANCSHNVHLENPKGYTTAVRAFLART